MKTKKKLHLTYPHCSDRTLHKPGECKFCDELPEWQALREAWGIAFTGHSDDTETFYNPATKRNEQRPLIPCPSERDRSADDIHRWHGNRPQAVCASCLTHTPGECDGSGPSCVLNFVSTSAVKDHGHYHSDGTFIDWARPGIPQCPSVHGNNQQCQWKLGHTGPHQECMEVWTHD